MNESAALSATGGRYGMKNGEHVNILLVDDQPAKLLTYESILANLGENLIKANSAREALEYLLRTDIAVVLVDVCMPELDGFELVNMIRQHPRFQKTAIIFISAVHLTDLDRLKGYECGAVDYVPVPVVPEILRAKVSVFADLYRKTHQLEALNHDLERRVAERTAELEAAAARLRESEERLKEADHRKDEFLATLAHELRNPLAPIRNAARVLRLKATPDSELQWCGDVIDRQTVHLTRLVDDLLDVSRITRNQLELRRERVVLATVIAGAVESSRPLIDGLGHELTVTLPKEPLFLSADAIRLTQVVTNLLNNAATYTPAGGRIRLEAELDASCHRAEVVLRVKDSGIGIPPGKLPRVFEMFYQVDRSLERPHSGLGIGLTLVQRLVEMHGGTVEAISAGPELGAEFVVRLPAVDDALTAAPPSPPSAPASSARRVLVVDDNVDSAESLAILLRLNGCEVTMAHDGVAALEAGQSFRPDVILLDIGMPRLNGYDAAVRIRQQPWGKSVFLVAVTGWGQDEDRTRAREAGFDAHLLKPVDDAAVMRLVTSTRAAARSTAPR